MNILTPNRAKLDQPVSNAFDKVLSAISGVWSIEHHDDGTHGNVTADSLTVAAVSASKVGNITGSLVPTSAAGELGTVLPNIPGATGPFLAWLALHVTTIYFETFRSTPSAAVVRRPRMNATSFSNDANSSDFTWTLSDNIGNTHTLTIGNGLVGLTSNRTVQGAFVYSTSDVQADTGYFERSRSVALGEWTTVTYASGNFTASAGTWTVGSGDQVTFEYMLVGKTLFVNFSIDTTSTSAGMGADLKIAIPGGFTCTHQVRQPIRVFDNGVGETGYARVDAGATLIVCRRGNDGAWTSGVVDNTYVQGCVAFQVN